MILFREKPWGLWCPIEANKCSHCGFSEKNGTVSYYEGDNSVFACAECFDVLHANTLHPKNYGLVFLPSVDQKNLFHMIRTLTFMMDIFPYPSPSDRNIPGSKRNKANHLHDSMKLMAVYLNKLIAQTENKLDETYQRLFWTREENKFKALARINEHFQSENKDFDFVQSFRLIPLKIDKNRVKGWKTEGSLKEMDIKGLLESEFFYQSIGKTYQEFEAIKESLKDMLKERVDRSKVSHSEKDKPADLSEDIQENKVNDESCLQPTASDSFEAKFEANGSCEKVVQKENKKWKFLTSFFTNQKAQS